MRYLLIFEIIALLPLPFLMAILRRRNINFEKPMAIAVATLLALIGGTYWLYLRINSEPSYLLTLKDWLIAVSLSLPSWVLIYSLGRWLYEQWFQ